MVKLALKTEPFDYGPAKKHYDSPNYTRRQDFSLLRWNQVMQLPREDIQSVREHLRVTLEEQVVSSDQGHQRERLESIYKLTGHVLDGSTYDQVRQEYPSHNKFSDHLHRIITHRNLLCGK